MMLMWLKIDCRGPGGFNALEAQVSFESIHHQSPHNVVPIVIKNPFSSWSLLMLGVSLISHYVDFQEAKEEQEAEAKEEKADSVCNFTFILSHTYLLLNFH